MRGFFNGVRITANSTGLASGGGSDRGLARTPSGTIRPARRTHAVTSGRTRWRQHARGSARAPAAAPPPPFTYAQRPPRALLRALKDALQLALPRQQPPEPLQPEPEVAAVQEPPQVHQHLCPRGSPLTAELPAPLSPAGRQRSAPRSLPPEAARRLPDLEVMPGRGGRKCRLRGRRERRRGGKGRAVPDAVAVCCGPRVAARRPLSRGLAQCVPQSRPAPGQVAASAPVWHQRSPSPHSWCLTACV